MNQQKNIHYFEDVNYLKFLNPTYVEKLCLVVGECFPSSTSVSFVFLLKLLCAPKGELSRHVLLKLYIPKKCLALVFALDCLLGEKL